MSQLSLLHQRYLSKVFNSYKSICGTQKLISSYSRLISYCNVNNGAQLMYNNSNSTSKYSYFLVTKPTNPALPCSHNTYATDSAATVPTKVWELGRLNHVAIAVPDLEVATAFYRLVLYI